MKTGSEWYMTMIQCCCVFFFNGCPSFLFLNPGYYSEENTITKWISKISRLIFTESKTDSYHQKAEDVFFTYNARINLKYLKQQERKSELWCLTQNLMKLVVFLNTHANIYRDPAVGAIIIVIKVHFFIVNYLEMPKMLFLIIDLWGYRLAK